MTTSGIEPATFWIVAQCLNQQRYRVALNEGYTGRFIRRLYELCPCILHLMRTNICS